MTTPFREHVDRWSNCMRCGLCEGRQKVVLCRGKIPCQILFIGEAPGEGEDTLGFPFVGPAGQLLDTVVKKAIPDTVRCAFTNLVCCIPRDAEGKKVTEPDDEFIKACAPRLRELIQIANPDLIVCVGRLAEDFTDPGYKHAVKFHRPIDRISIKHPAAILRENVANKGLSFQRCVVTLTTAVEDLLKKKG